MPIIRVEMWEGRNIETKKEFVKKITDVTCETLGCSKDAVTIVIYDVAKHNWAQNGKLAEEK